MSLSLVITYASGRRSEPVRLEHRAYTVGSAFSEADDEAGAIPLLGRDISPHQFFLFPDGQSERWFIEAVGTTPTWLGDQMLARDEPAEIRANQIVRVPNATIQLRFDGSAGAGEGQAAAYDAWRRLQDQIHAALVDEFQLENKKKLQNRQEAATRHRILDMLMKKAADGVEVAAPDAVRAAVGTALRLAVLRTIAGASGEEAENAFDDGPPRPGQLAYLAGQIAQRLGLELIVESVERDSERVEAGFSAVFDDLYPMIGPGDRAAIARGFIARNVWNFIYHFGPVTDLMELAIVTEVMIVRHDRIYIERFGKLERYDYAFTSRRQLEVLLQRVVSDAGRELNQANAMVDFRLPDGSRVNVVDDPLSINGPCVTIRRHRKDRRWTLDRLVEEGSLSAGVALFLKAAVAARRNIIVSGGTGSGKTTLLNALSAYVPDTQRVVTIEDTAELALESQHVVSLQSRPATVEGRNEVTIRHLVRNALRMRPDRIIVGECRGGEAVDMLQALNTGHAGSMTTAHANGPLEMLMRLEVMVLQGEPNLPSAAIRRQIVNAIDLVVQLNKVEGAKRLTEVAEVIDLDPETGELIVEPIFVFRGAEVGFDPPRHCFTGYLPSFVDEIAAAAETLGRAQNGAGGDRPVVLEDMFA